MKKEYLRIISEYVGIFPVEINSALVSAQNRERWYWTNIQVKKIGLFDELYTDIPQPEDKGILLMSILQPENEIDKKYYLSDIAIARIKRKIYSEAKINPDKTGTLNTKNNSGQLSVDSGTTLISDRGSAGAIKTNNTGKAEPLKSHNGCGNHSDMDIIKNGDLRRLTPIECSRLQTIPSWYKWECSDSQIYRMLGNGWTVDIICHIFNYLK